MNEKEIEAILKDYVLVNKDAWRPLIFQGKLVFDPNSVNRKKVIKEIMDKIKEEEKVNSVSTEFLINTKGY